MTFSVTYNKSIPARRVYTNLHHCPLSILQTKPAYTHYNKSQWRVYSNAYPSKYVSKFSYLSDGDVNNGVGFSIK